MFYVYEYFKKDTNEVFYVGKGTKRRMYELHNRSKYFQAVYEKYDCDVRIIANDITNEESCELERQRIAELWAVGQAYCNFTAGGTGFSTGELNPIHERIANGEISLFATRRFIGEENGFYGRTHTDETKRRISENRKGKGARFGKDNPMFGKGFKGEDNPMYGRTGEKHPNVVMFRVEHIDGSVERLTSKQCEVKFGIAFTRIRLTGGVLHYKKKTKNNVYEGTVVMFD